ncbi:MAG: ferrochelatase [Phycisphaerales bacterium]|nr:MAG: ferrochelatase [Phycisphaerales bacterium]
MSLCFPDKKKRENCVDGGRSAPVPRRAVLLINTGAPATADVACARRYPGEAIVVGWRACLRWLRGGLGRLIARLGTGRLGELHRRTSIERASLPRVIMAEQASALESALPDGWRAFVAMGHGGPAIADVTREIVAAGIEELVMVPMYPQFSRTTTGAVIGEVYRALREVGRHLRVSLRTTWYDDGGYLSAQAKLVAEYALRRGLKPADTHLVFSAHGLPVSHVSPGAPYVSQVEQSAALVAQRLGWPADRCTLAYQSPTWSGAWLKPGVREVLKELCDAGERRVLVCPISLAVDCPETLEEMDVRCREEFESRGGALHVCPVLNDYGPFIDALKNLALRGPQRVTSWGSGLKPLLAAEPCERPADRDLKSLVMIGASLESRQGPGRGPRLDYTEPRAFASIKKPQDDVLVLLRSAREAGVAREALVWNTCHRFEFYGWLEKPGKGVCAVARARSRLFDKEPPGLEVNVLFGKEAWHHLARTAAGLNSGLPGDADVVAQLQTAHRVAEGAGTAGPRLKRLLDEATSLVESVRGETEWGQHDPGYCLATVSRIREAAGLDLPGCEHVVVGGSTTSCSVLHTLRDRFDVNHRRMTLVYRSHRGGQMKLLRKAIGNGRRLRVQVYTEQAVIEAIAGADVVYFGIDADEPVLKADDLRGVRDFSDRPLTVIDFNTFGSTSGLSSIPGVSVWNASRLEKEVASYAEEMSARDRFAAAIEEAEGWIAERTPPAVATALDLPCLSGGRAVHPRCVGCGTGAESVTVRTAVI